MISLSTACLYHLPLACVFRLAAEAGFDGVELVMGPEVWLRGPGHVARLAREWGLPVLTVHQTLLPASPEGPGGGRMVDAAATATAVGAAHVVIHAPNVASWRDEAAVRWLSTLERARERLLPDGARLALENWGLDARVRRRPVLTDLAELADFARDHDLDMTFDTCHAGMMGLDLLGAYETLSPGLANLHLSNFRPEYPPLALRPLRPLINEHRLPEDGILALGPVVSRLVSSDRGVPITYEISPIHLRAWHPRALRERLAGLVAYVQRHTAGPR